MAKIQPNDLFVVQLQDTIHTTNVGDVVSLDFMALKNEVVQLAIPGPSVDGSGGHAGIMFPGIGFEYDENTGQLDVRLESDLKFIDILEYNDTPSGAEVKGQFYLSGHDDLVLDTAYWNLVNSSDSLPGLGSLVVCVQSEDSVHGLAQEWNVVPNVTGAQAVLDINAVAQYPGGMLDSDRFVEVIVGGASASPQRPLVRIRKAQKVADATQPDGFRYYGGLLDDDDYEKLSFLDVNLIEDGWVNTLVTAGDPVTDDALYITGYDTNTVYHDLVIGVNEAEDSVYGVTKFASDLDIAFAIGINESFSGNENTTHRTMTPERTNKYFVPKDFSTLPEMSKTGGP